MKIYKFIDLDGTHALTRDEILEQYWEYWTSQMKRIGKEDLISEDNCITDFMVIHWAWTEEEHL